jgi:LysM repeat protein
MIRRHRWQPAACAVALAAALLISLTSCGGGGEAKPSPTPNDVMMVVTPTPGTPVPHTPTPSTGEQTYTVREGDNLSGIAARFGISEKALEKANNITDPNSIYAGQVLVIPAP